MAKFLSKCPNHVLCINPADRMVHNGTVMNVAGKHIRFDNGEYETNDESQIEFIKGHRLFGTQIIEGNKVKPKANNPDE